MWTKGSDDDYDDDDVENVCDDNNVAIFILILLFAINMSLFPNIIQKEHLLVEG